MNIDNIEKAVKIKQRIVKNKQAVEEIDRFLSKYPNGNSDGTCCHGDKKLYYLFLCEFQDGSGVKVDLAGSLVQTEILEATKKLLISRIESDHEVIKML